MLHTSSSFNDRKTDTYSMQYILNTYMAFVEAIVPWSPKLAAEYGEVQYYGAIDSLTYEYLIDSLYQLGGVPLLKSTAEILDMAARELVLRGENEFSFNLTKGVTFSALIPTDRLSALNILKQKELASYDTTIPTEKFIVDLLIKLTLLGYYSEWSGYGLTRLDEPDQRVLEFQPVSWEQVGYPGPNRG